MPYIAPEARLALDNEVTRDIETVGELTYQITMGLLEVPLDDLKEYIVLSMATYIMSKPRSYALYNGAIGAVMCALLNHTWRTNEVHPHLELMAAEIISSFFRKVVIPYEKAKIAENGDIPQYAALTPVPQQQPTEAHA